MPTPAIIGNPSSTLLGEDIRVENGQIYVVGQIPIIEFDPGEAGFMAEALIGPGQSPTFSIDVNGNYRYAVPNVIVQFLAAGETRNDSFTVTSIDGTKKTITFTIVGQNDAAVIVGPPVLTLGSSTAAAVGGNNNSYDPSISDNGTRIAFSSDATNLVAGDINTFEDVFVKTVATNEIVNISRAADGTLANGDSFDADISGDGTKVAFTSFATNLVAADNNGVVDIYVKNIATGAITLVSQTAAGGRGNGQSYTATQSSDGSKVAFVSESNNLTTGDSNGLSDIFVKDLNTGELRLVSQGAAVANGASYESMISGNGEKVVFTSFANSFTANGIDNNGLQDVFIANTAAPVGNNPPAAPVLISATAAGQSGNGASFGASVSADGTKVAFTSQATNLSAFDTDIGGDIYVKNITTGALTLVSTNVFGEKGNGVSTFAEISADGTKVTFRSTATNLVGYDPNGNIADVFVKDLITGEVKLISQTTAGDAAVGNSTTPTLSADGSVVAFASAALNLVPNNSALNTSDIFVVRPVNPNLATVTEDVGVVTGNLVATGTIGITDADANQASFRTQVIPANGNLGALTLAANGAYTYTVNNSLPALQALNTGQTKVDSFTVTSFDGTTKVVTFTINGVNEPANTPAVIGNPTVASVTEDNAILGFLTAEGSISVTDADAGQASFLTTVVPTAGNLGTLVINAAGNYRYSVDNSLAAVQALNAGQTKVDSFTVSSLDGTTKLVNFTINGVNELPANGETLFFDTPDNQFVTGTTANDVFVYNTSSANFFSAKTLDGTTGTVVWNGAKFDILTGIEKLRFTDKDVTADANGVFNIQSNSTGAETLILDTPDTQFVTGTTANDVFVYNTSSANFYSAKTLDGTTGTVVWNGTKFDILTGVEKLRFTDKDVTADANGVFNIQGTTTPTTPENLIQDTAQTQFVTGTTTNDVFVYNMSSANFYSAKTQDGTTGTVVWNGTKFDILTGVEKLRFTDKDVTADANGVFNIQGTAPAIPVTPVAEVLFQNVAGTQYLTGTSPRDVFVANGNAAEFGYAKTQDGTGIVVWKESNFDILTGFEVIRFNDGIDVLTSSIV